MEGVSLKGCMQLVFDGQKKTVTLVKKALGGLFIANTKWGVKQRDDPMSIMKKLVYFSTGFIVFHCDTLP